MDGIARNTDGFDAGLARRARPRARRRGPLLVGLLGDRDRRRGAAPRPDVAPRLVRRLDRFIPRPARRIAAAAASLAVALLGPRRAYASDAPVRDWLSGSTTTTHDRAATTPTGPVATQDRPPPRRATTATAPADRDAVATEPARRRHPPATEPGAHGRSTVEHVVVEGDCLWSIAARAPRVRTRPTPRSTPPGGPSTPRNRAAIGDDPNLIFPGLSSQLPPFDRPLQPTP